MTPRNKAIEIYNKYSNIKLDVRNNCSDVLSHIDVIECSLISVDETIRACEYIREQSKGLYWLREPLEYWTKVKRHLESYEKV